MRSNVAYWTIGYVFAIVFLTLATYRLVEMYRVFNPNLDQLTSEKAADQYLHDYWVKEHISKDKIPLLVPAGIFVDSLRWIDAQSFYISGYVWQKYTEASRQLAKPGFTMPDAVELEVRQAYNVHVGADEVVGWYFGGKFNQGFDYSKFPLDDKTVKIRIWHGDFDQRVLLKPDFHSYDHTGLHEVFGLSPEIVLGGYRLLDTYFLYQHSHYDTNLGLPSFARKLFPELTFNIVLKRDVSNVLIIHLTPLCVVIFLCFLLLMSITFDERKRQIFHFRYLEMITVSAALFFAVILAHVHLRESITWQGYAYFEYFYLITYASILYMTADAFLVAHDDLSRFRFYRIIQYRDNLVPKVLFFPLIALAALVMTLACF
ncbi:MAG TPA: hypothetical protein VEL47_08010 [Myxococcota bacterium]|nr:hypothetical protein [Myxococcota bacterium]